MLVQLTIKNYALIDDISVSFTDGFTTITGETGAGKSILLGGLSLVLGKRADLSSLRDQGRKCTIEAEFDIENYRLETFFREFDLEYDLHTIIRREIHPSGKSRAFINDSPVTLDVLGRLGKKLVDVHSQHQTLQLTEEEFQLKVIDSVASNDKFLVDYSEKLKKYKGLNKALAKLLETQQNSIKDQDYHSFLYEELVSANLKPGLQQELEEEYEQLSHVETILEQLASADQLLNDEQSGMLTAMFQLKQIASRLSGFGNHYQQIHERLDSCFIEMDDIGSELQTLRDGVEINPQRMEEVGDKLQKLFDLQKKHGVGSEDELIRIREELAEKISITENLDQEIEETEEQLKVSEAELSSSAHVLSERRADVIPRLKQRLEDLLSKLGMPNASFQISLVPAQEFASSGKDQLLFLFSANKGSEYGSLKKVASGGELSRIMLVIKSVLAEHEKLPTLIFDEIDSGVSGEISNNMADIMLEMSRHMQLFSITHLPQVASKGHQHFKVYKEEEKSKTYTQIRLLSSEERVVELAEMLGGKALSDSALAHAKQLLN